MVSYRDGRDGSDVVQTATQTSNTLAIRASNAPSFSPDTYTAFIAEDASPADALVTTTGGSTAFSVPTATVGETGTLSYVLTGSTLFELNGTGTQIVLATGASLDHETTPSYTLTLTVTESGTSLTDTATVTVTVTDVNDEAPVFAANQDADSVAEDLAPSTTPIRTFAATGDAGATVTYTITGGNAGNLFAIDGATGALTLASALDFETATSHVLTITATAGTETEDLTYTLTVTNVTQTASPVIAGTQTVGGTLTATFTPAGDTTIGTPTYEWQTNATGSFVAIPGETGTTYTTDADDAGDTIQVVVSYRDGRDGSDVVQTATQTSNTLAIRASNAPSFSPDTYTAFIAEDASPADALVTTTGGSTAFSVPTATVGETGTLSYVLTGSTLFELNGTGTQIVLATGASLDHETTPSYTLTLTVTESGTSLTDTATVTVTVDDVNDEAPVFAANQDADSVAEDLAPSTTPIRTFAATGDAGATVTYTITGGNAGNLFAIDGATGALTLASALDFETATSHELTITATAGTETENLTYTLTVTNVTQTASPVIAGTQTVGGTLTATFTPAGDTTIGTPTYEWQTNATGSFVAIPGETGTTYTTDADDAGDTIQVVVSYRDGRDGSDVVQTATQTSNTLAIRASNAPSFSPDTYTAFIAEDASPADALVTTTGGSTAFSVPTATVGETGTLSYVLTGSTLFELNGTGTQIVLATGASLDHETTPSYTLTLTVTESGTSLTDTATVTVTVDDVNDEAPVFAANQDADTVAEDLAPSTTPIRTFMQQPVTQVLPLPTALLQVTQAVCLLSMAHPVTLTLASALDFETATSHVLTITATAGTETEDLTYTLTVTDVTQTASPVIAGTQTVGGTNSPLPLHRQAIPR